MKSASLKTVQRLFAVLTTASILLSVNPAPGATTFAFTFTDRADAKAGENSGLTPQTSGYATGLQVTFAGTGGTLANPQVPGIVGATAQIIGGNTVRINLPAGMLMQPAAWGVAGAAANKLAIKVDSDFGATPASILWLAPLVNVVPKTLSGEVNNDAEPHIAVSPSTPDTARSIAVTTFSRVGGGAGTPWGQAVAEKAPVWLSADGGLTWGVRDIVPPPVVLSGPHDQTLAFNGDGSQLYGVFVGLNNAAPVTASSYVRRTANPFTTDFGAGSSFGSFGPGASLVTDQPWVQVGPTAGGNDRVYVALNDTSFINAAAGQGRTALTLVSSDSGVTFAAANRTQIDSGGPAGRQTRRMDGPAVRVAGNGDTVYGAFVRFTAAVAGNSVVSDIIVVRDDKGGIWPGIPFVPPFQALGVDGSIVPGTLGAPAPPARSATSFPRIAAPFGNQRIGADLSIAVDPNHANVVFVARADMDLAHITPLPDLRVFKSTDSGVNWAQVLFVPNSALPAVAVNDRGDWALLCMSLTPRATRYSARLIVNGGAEQNEWESWNNPGAAAGMYFGDYLHLMAVGDRFYGTFCGDNFPTADPNDGNHTDFPQGVVYQRNADFFFSDLRDAGGALGVNHSIDPFVFSFTPKPPPPAPPRPRIRRRTDPDFYELRWGDTGFSFTLEQAGSVLGPWSPTAETPVLQDGEYSVVVHTNVPVRYYRLRGSAQVYYNLASGADIGGMISPTGTISVLPGGSQTFTASADSGFVIGQWYLDGSPAQYGTGSLTVTNLQANHSVFVAFRPLDDLGVTVNTDPGPVELEEDAEIPLGSNFVYQIEVVNKGLNPASNVTVTNTLPSGVNYVGATSTQGSISYASGIVAVQIGAMASGQTVIVLITVSAASLGDQDDLVQVSGSAVEPYTDNNSASVTVDISPP